MTSDIADRIARDIAIEYPPYDPITCALHCSDGRLPVDGERDSTDGLELLYATDWVKCPACSASLNPDLACNPRDVQRAFPQTAGSRFDEGLIRRFERSH